MSNYEKLADTAKDSGFTHYAPLDVSTLDFMQEIRDMCNADKCRNYNTSWSCPPACVSLEEMRDRVKGYETGILVQTVGELEDSLDWDGIQATGERHKENFKRMRAALDKKPLSVLALGAGKCNICEECTYPDSPCLFPEKMEVSMEASGLFVSKVCTDNNLAYNYGPERIAFTSCFLVEY
jgi:predicted metal-binding protein